MKVNKITIAVALIAVFLLGLLLGFNIKGTQHGEGSIDLNPIPASCQYNDKTYKSGERFPAKDGCNSCTCDDGKTVCTLMGCE